MDRERKKQLKAQAKANERAAFVASYPVPVETLRELFEFLNRDDAPACDHTLRETALFLAQRSIDAERVIPWLLDHGGGCDCEVVMNTHGEVAEAEGWVDA
jgi:hypothetical protein